MVSQPGEVEPDAPRVAVIGGSGLYELLDDAKSVPLRTPYGAPSSDVAIGTLGGRQIAFLPRHGPGHTLAPHEVPYRANLWALASLGVRAVVTSSAVGGLSPALPPDTFAVPDQLIDRTHGRPDTYSGSGRVTHVPLAEPFCPQLVALAVAAVTGLGERVASPATTVVIQGPRFSTRAESRWFRAAGGSIVNMTQYPEVALAAELNMGLVNLSYVTDTDSGDADLHPHGDPDAVDPALVLARMARATPRIVAALTAIVAAIGEDYQPRELVPPETVQAVLAEPPT